jgi:hypothetical protein
LRAHYAHYVHVLTFSDLLCKILTPTIFGVHKDVDQSLIGSAIIALENYMNRADTLHPFRTPQFTLSGPELDSQESFGLSGLDVDRQMMIHVRYLDRPCL